MPEMRELIRTDLPLRLDEPALMQRLHCRSRDSEIFQRALELARAALPQIKSGYIVREFPIEALNEIGPILGGQQFRSKITAAKLQGQQTVFVYIATCGRAISELVDSCGDELDKYLLDQVAYLAYLQSMDELSQRLESEFGVERHVRLCPGSIIDWSVDDVKKFFVLMDGLYQQLDLRVLDSGLIEPLKSTSGLLYPTDEEFESCAICPRSHCENRRVPFDPDQHEAMSNL